MGKKRQWYRRSGKGKGEGEDGRSGEHNTEVEALNENGEVKDDSLNNGEEDAKPAAKRPKQDVWREDPGSWEMVNPGYEAYYQKQCVCPPAEWSQLLETLRTGLPTAIRVNRMRAGSEPLCARLREMQADCYNDTERKCYSPEQLQWYPHGLAWHWRELERRQIKKDHRHTRLKNYFAQRERRGIISRQEVVSMIPPLFLDVKPDHWVLDLCAAPGSKTSQMLEIMHWGEAAENKCPPKGMVLANEIQWRRANMLAHQVQRMGSPCAGVTNTDAQYFPDLWAPSDEHKKEPFRFHRVLCDVPCSGDGTMRKTPYIWKSWNKRDGIALHIRQLNILYRGLDVLQVGGRLVYSTCSLNPIEDEAVVAAALTRHGDALCLVPPPPLEGMRKAAGLQTWFVPHLREEDQYFGSYADVPSDLKNGKPKLIPSMFPPADDIQKSIQECCCRFLPHLMDTGGFFVTIFEKKSEFLPSQRARKEARKEECAAARSADAEDTEAAPRDQAKPLRPLTKEYTPIVDILGTAQAQEIADFYGFDSASAKRLMCRGGSEKHIFLISEGLEALLAAQTRMPTRMVLCGVLVLQQSGSYHERALPWQLVQGGLQAACSVGLKRCIFASSAFLCRLISERDVSLAELRSAVESGEVDSLQSLTDPADPSTLTPGSLAVVLRSQDGVNMKRPIVSVASIISDDALEVSATKDEVAAILEDLNGQPSVSEILGGADGEVELGGVDDAVQNEEAQDHELDHGDAGEPEASM